MNTTSDINFHPNYQNLDPQDLQWKSLHRGGVTFTQTAAQHPLSIGGCLHQRRWSFLFTVETKFTIKQDQTRGCLMMLQKALNSKTCFLPNWQVMTRIPVIVPGNLFFLHINESCHFVMYLSFILKMHCLNPNNPTLTRKQADHSSIIREID